MPTVNLAPNPKFRAFANNGAPLAYGKLFSYASGTTNKQATYADYTGIVPNTNPVILDARGEANVWLDPTLSYKFVLAYSTDGDPPSNPIWTEDGIAGVLSPLASIIPATDNTLFLGSPTASWAGLYLGPNHTLIPDPISGQIAYYPQSNLEKAAGITPGNPAYPWGNVLRYGADPNGANDSTAAFNLATAANYSPITAPSAYRTVTVPAGQYKITNTVYVPAGVILKGDGMSSYIDASNGFAAGANNVFRLGWSLVNNVPTQDTIYLTGGYPPEIANLFVNGGPANASVVSIVYPGALCHDMWFSQAGQAVYLAGGYLYDCEIDGGLTGMTLGGSTNQTVSNVRFFNQNVAINVDVTTADIADTLISGCTIEYPKVVGVQLGSGTKNVRGLKLVGCNFTNNPNSTVTSFANCVSIALANAKVEIDSCTFENWGQFAGGAGTAAILVQAAGAVVDVKGCIFDGQPSSTTYTASTTALALTLNSGTLRVTDSQFRNMPVGGGILNYGGTAQCVCEMDGVNYSGLLSASAVFIGNTNGASTFFASNVKGDGTVPFLNAQSVIATELKNMSRWFGPIKTSGGSNYVNGVPYQPSGIFQITITANQNVGGSGNYRKSRVDLVEKDNDTSTTAKSLLNFATLVQGANNTGGGGNAAMTLTVEFGTVGGGTSIANSNSGVLAISWPNTYTSLSLDVQVLQSG